MSDLSAILKQIKALKETEQEPWPSSSDIFKGIDAYILCACAWNEDTRDYDCEWYGGELAGVSNELMHEITPNPKIGDSVAIGVNALTIVLVDYSPLGDFWYVRRGDEGAA